MEDTKEVSNFEARYKSWHTRMSIVKSTIRFATSGSVVFWACFGQTTGAIVLISILAAGYGLAEFVGILEEL
jgi:hypothetical protein